MSSPSMADARPARTPETGVELLPPNAAETSRHDFPGWVSWSFLGLGLGVVVAYLAADGHELVQSMLFTGMTAAALAAVATAVWRQHRHGWGTLVVAMAVYLAATVQWYPMRVIQSEPPSFPSAGDFTFLLAYALLAVGLVRAAGRADRWFSLDALLLSAALGGPVAELVLRPALGTTSHFTAAMVAVAYPVALLVLLALTCRLALLDSRADKARWLLVVWMVFELAGDSWYSVSAANGSFTFGSHWFVLWLLGNTALGVAALHPRSAQKSPRRDTSLRVRLFLFPGVALIPLVTAAFVAADGHVPYFALAASAAIGALSMWRISSLGVDVSALERAHAEKDGLAAELRESVTRLRHLTRHDSLTGLANRVLFYERLDHLLVQPDRSPAVMLLDLDRFKEVNDTLGHGVGDEMLMAVAARLTSVVRSCDTVARLGGDEFVIILDDVDRAGAQSAAQRYLDVMHVSAFVGGHETSVSASAGLAVATDGQDATTIMRQADIAMYGAKRQGRGTLRMFDAPADDGVLKSR